MIPTGCERIFCDACNGSGYDYLEGRICDSCLGAGEVETYSDFQSELCAKARRALIEFLKLEQKGRLLGQWG